MKKSAFATNAQSRFASVVVDGVLGPPRLACHTWRCPCISVVPEATHKASRRPMKGAVSAEKALKGSETETRELLGGMEEMIVSSTRVHWFPLQANKSFFCKKEKETNWVSDPTWVFVRSWGSPGLRSDLGHGLFGVGEFGVAPEGVEVWGEEIEVFLIDKFLRGWLSRVSPRRFVWSCKINGGMLMKVLLTNVY